MATITQLQAIKQPPLTLHPTVLFEEYPTVHVMHTHNVSTIAAPVLMTHKQDLPNAPDSSDKEYLIQMIHEFIDACPNSCLHINNMDCYTEICNVLGGDLKTTWDDTIQGTAATDHTSANFPVIVTTSFIIFFWLTSSKFNKSISTKPSNPMTWTATLLPVILIFSTPCHNISLVLVAMNCLQMLWPKRMLTTSCSLVLLRLNTRCV